ncbi:MAG: alpha/beta fold hydrolase [Bacteroidota bacterium]
MKRLLYLLLLLGLVYLGLSWYLSSLVVYPARRTNAKVKELMFTRAGIDIDTFRTKLPAEAEAFEVSSQADGIKIVGSYFPQDTSRCAVVIAHGYGSTRLSMMKYAPLFYDCGCDIVVYDHRAHGESGGVHTTGGIREGKDLLSVTQWLMDRSDLDRSAIGWMGESWGGATVLHAGATDEDVAFIIAESAFQDWETAVFERAIEQYGPIISWFKAPVWAIVSWRIGEDAYAASVVEQAPKVKEPTLILHSDSDVETAPYQSANIAAALPETSHRYHPLDWGAKHGNNVFTRPAEYRALLFTFIRDFVPEWETRMNCLVSPSDTVTLEG